MSGEKQANKEAASPTITQKKNSSLGESQTVYKIDALQLMADSSNQVKQLQEKNNRINKLTPVQQLKPLDRFSTEHSSEIKKDDVQNGTNSTKPYQLLQKLELAGEKTMFASIQGLLGAESTHTKLKKAIDKFNASDHNQQQDQKEDIKELCNEWLKRHPDSEDENDKSKRDSIEKILANIDNDSFGMGGGAPATAVAATSPSAAVTSNPQTAASPITPTAFHPEEADKGYDLANEKGTDPEYNVKKAQANNVFMNQSGPFEHEGFLVFSARVTKLLDEFGTNAGDQADEVARAVWTKVYDEEKLQQELDKLPMSDPALGWINMEALRERHEKKAQDDILASFSIVENSVQTALQSQFLRANSFAFWSGPVAKEIVLHHNGADIGLETSALGGLFNGININGKWDGALWAGLSHMYANAVVKYAQGKEVRVFCSPKAALKNIYTAVEFPALKEAFENGVIKIKNYPCAPDTDLCYQKYVKDGNKIDNCHWEKEPDKDIQADGIPGTYKPLEGGVEKRNEAATIATENMKKRIDEREQSATP